jgi:hypothetical protein
MEPLAGALGCGDHGPGDPRATAAAMKAVPADKIESKKGEILQVAKALHYLAQFKILAEEPTARQELEAIIKANDWEPKKK